MGAQLRASVVLLTVWSVRQSSCLQLPLLVEPGLRLGQSSLRSSIPLGVGTWSWGNRVLWQYDESHDEDIRLAWKAAVEGGVSFFDTGDSYGTGRLEGRAEELLGQFRKNDSQGPFGSRQLTYGTKLAIYPWRQSPESFVDALRSSLARMQLDRVEIAQAHWSARNYWPPQDRALLEGLARCYELGLCEAVGLSNFGPRALTDAATFFADRGVPVALNQVQFSLLSTEPERTGLLQLCREELGITPVAYSPLALGALAADPQSYPDGPRAFLFNQVSSLGATSIV